MRGKIHRKIIPVFFIFFSVNSWCQDKITVAAASSLEKCFTKDIIPEFRKIHPDIKIEATFDGSGKLKKQIEQGMNVQIFLSASLQHLPRRDQFVAEEVNLLENRLVLIGNSRHKGEFRDFSHILNAKTVVLGNPDIVPAGYYAKELLEHLGLWEKLHSRTSVSLASNVAEVLSAVVLGAAQCGFVYSTDAAPFKDRIYVACEAQSGISPIVYPLVLLKKGEKSAAVRKFYDFLQSRQALEIFRRYGFKTVIK